MKEPIISISGIRGIFGESLTPENITKFTSAFAAYSGKGRIVIGRDGRLNGEIIEKIVESVLLFSGCEVINLGTAPTPTISLAVEQMKAGGGIAITASHNPQQWNGMKFINAKGIFLDAAENKAFMKFILKNDPKYVSVDRVKPVEYYPSFADYHIQRVLNISSINVNKIRKREFKVVADCVNSSGSYIIPELLQRLGCKVIKLDSDGSGIFTRKPEPVPENL
ncbi:MAG: phosphoglucosamine mutase, partial [Ignavibacteria bacterium]|nr:phosphoglucosamine mutase [Ignavibacteria bacterium]